MKILIVSRPRCRTSFLCQASSMFYNILDLHEDYDFNLGKGMTDSKRYALLKKNPGLQQLSQNLCSHVRTVSDKVEKNNGAIKFFPRHLLSYFYTSLDGQAAFRDFETFNYTCETNLTDLFKLHMYDQIIFLERDLVDSLMSFAYALENKQMLYTQHEAKYASKKQKKVYIESNFVFDKLNFNILEYHLYIQVKNFITKNFDNFITLNYDTCLDYVKNNYNIENRITYGDTKFNYVNNIENYVELKSYMLDTFDKYSTLIPNFDFK